MFGDGLQTRDYVYVGDVVEANLAAAESDVRRRRQHRHRGARPPCSTWSRRWRQQADGPFEAEHEPERLGEVRHIALDATRAREELGWTAQVSVPDGLERTLSSLR